MSPSVLFRRKEHVAKDSGISNAFGKQEVEIEGEPLHPLPLPPGRQASDRSTPSQRRVLERLKQQQEQSKKVANYASMSTEG